MVDQEDAKRGLGRKRSEQAFERIHLVFSKPSRRHQRWRRDRRGYADQRQRAAATQRRKGYAIRWCNVAGKIASPFIGKAIGGRANIGIVIAGNGGHAFRRTDTLEPGL